MMQRRTQLIREAIYSLKHAYGQDIILHRDTETINRSTGKRIVTKVTRKVRKAILLEENVERQFILRLAGVVANREFSYGGWFDAGRRTIIIDNRELGNFRPNNSDYVVYAGERLEIKGIRRLEKDMLTLLNTESVVGPTVEAQYDLKGRGRLIFGQQAVGVK